MFNHQKTSAHQPVNLQCQPLASHFVLNVLLSDFSNIYGIYKSHQPTIWSKVQLLKTESEFENLSPSENPQYKRSLLSFLGDALKWLTDMATTKHTWEIKQHVNQLIQEQTKEQETLVHIISILNITRYTIEVNRQKLNEMIGALPRSNKNLIDYSILQRFWHNTMDTNRCISTFTPY